MSRRAFAAVSILGASAIQLLACSVWFAQRPTSDGGLQALLPGLVWIIGTLLVVVLAPFWLRLVFGPWSRFEPTVVRLLLLAPWLVVLAGAGAALAFLVLGASSLVLGGTGSGT